MYNNLIDNIIEPPKVNNTDCTIDRIIEDRCSVSRYGEGEFKLMYGENLLFQNKSEELIERMKEIILSNEENHIICIPDVFSKLDRFNCNSRRFWSDYLNTDRAKIYRILDMEKIYYDALMTRVYMDYENKGKSENLFNKIKQIWNERDVTIIEGEKSRLGVGNDLFNNTKTLNRILCPSENAFEKYNQIIDAAVKEDKDRLMLIALGPTATVLAYDLHKLGYQSIDIGHIDVEYEWFLQGVLTKCSIKNKYVGEVANGANISSNIENDIYGKQIISSIV